MIAAQGEWLKAIGYQCGVGVGMIAAQGEWLMAIGCQCGVWEDRRRGWLKSIGCCVGWGGGDMTEDYRVSVWGGVGMIVTRLV